MFIVVFMLSDIFGTPIQMSKNRESRRQTMDAFLLLTSCSVVSSYIVCKTIKKDINHPKIKKWFKINL